MADTFNTWSQAGRKLRQKGYNHTAGDNYARINGKRMERARVVHNADGSFAIEELG